MDKEVGELKARTGLVVRPMSVCPSSSVHRRHPSLDVRPSSSVPSVVLHPQFRPEGFMFWHRRILCFGSGGFHVLLNVFYISCREGGAKMGGDEHVQMLAAKMGGGVKNGCRRRAVSRLSVRRRQSSSSVVRHSPVLRQERPQA